MNENNMILSYFKSQLNVLFFWSYQVYGGEPYIRSAEDIAFHVALFIARNGSYVNYYMVWYFYYILTISFEIYLIQIEYI
jgi:uncharacterized membrane protein (DUF106 family)